MSEPIYRQLSKDQYVARGGDRTWVENGQRYRITELVARIDGGANFQAVVDDRPVDEEENWPEVPEGLVSPELKALGCQGPPCRCGEKAAVLMGGCFADRLPQPPFEPPDFAPLPERPSLKVWAKDNGMWAGRGPVSGAAKAAYNKEFGLTE